MADIVLFGATGYTGKLTAAALAARGASFAICGRSESKLEALAAATGAPEVHVAEVGNVGSLVRALEGARVLISTVGPFTKLGHTAVRAAISAGVHYIDSTGEGPFVDRLADEYEESALEAGVVLAPAMGFDEVPGDVISTLAAEGMKDADVAVTYAIGRAGSAGTIRSALGVIGSTAPWLEDGRVRRAGAGAERRWTPFPPPLGVSESWAFPLALTRLAPRHLSLNSFKTFIRTSWIEGNLMRFGAPVLRVLDRPPFGRVLDAITNALPEGPSDAERTASKWMLVAEASSADATRTVIAHGTDMYGLTAQTLAVAAITMAGDGYRGQGLQAPVPAVGLEILQQVLVEHGTVIEVYPEG